MFEYYTQQTSFVHILPSCTCYWVMKDFVVKDPCIRKRRTFDSAMPHSLLIEILADKNLEYGECQKSKPAFSLIDLWRFILGLMNDNNRSIEKGHRLSSLNLISFLGPFQSTLIPTHQNAPIGGCSRCNIST